MNNNDESTKPRLGTLGLPEVWSAAVQLTGTFGLAVFLVLYYVLFMQPKAQARYDQLSVSVDSLIEVVERGQTVVTREQGDRLEELYILGVSPELADRIERLLPDGAVSAAAASALRQELRANLEDVLIVRTRLLRGLSLRDSGDVSQMLADKIRERDIAEHLAGRAVLEWPFASQEDVADMCKESLYFAFRKTALAK
jgi:hypothetical protein